MLAPEILLRARSNLVVARTRDPTTVGEVSTTSTPKGRNKRCGDEPWVGGVPTTADESVWVLRGDVVTQVRGRHQFSELPEHTLVAPKGQSLRAEDFAIGAALPAGVWSGYTSASLARGGTSKRRGAGLYSSTLAANPDLTRRLGGSTPVRTRPATNLHADAPTTEAVEMLSREIAARGGRALVVGGAVRDMVAGQLSGSAVAVKDLDVEVYGIDPGELHALVEAHFAVGITGAAFAVLKATVPGASEQLDISVPRRERAVGEGHRDFEVSADPSLSFVEAAYRRDFTIGAMGYDPLTGEVFDPYGGAADLASGILRHVSPAFSEDPLRALRAARFAARFDLRVHPDTVALCRSLRPQAMALPAERRWGEIEMTLAQAARPGQALYVLDEIEWIDIFTELAALRGVEQDPGRHPEGDVFTHTAEVLNYWGTHLRTGVTEDDLVVSVAAMCHDFGKTSTTFVREGRLTSHGHEEAGIAPARTLLHSLGQMRLADNIAPLIANHLAPVKLLHEGASNRALRRLSVRVPRLDLLTLVAKADQGGRPPKDPTAALAECDRFYERVLSLDLEHGAPANLARGEDLIALGRTPGPEFREMLGAVYDAQLDGDITTRDQAKEMLARLVASKNVKN